jgi:hypothetical protein
MLVRPLSTHHKRPSRNGDFALSDERETLLIGDMASQDKDH